MGRHPSMGSAGRECRVPDTADAAPPR
jgi:hypothetical protein